MSDELDLIEKEEIKQEAQYVSGWHKQQKEFEESLKNYHAVLKQSQKQIDEIKAFYAIRM